MKKRRRTKLVHEGQYVAEVDVELIDMDKGWSPYLSLDDAYKLDEFSRETVHQLIEANILAGSQPVRPRSLLVRNRGRH